MKKTIFFLVLSLCTTLSIANQNLNQSAKRFATAMMAFDFATMAKLSHPAVVKAYGGQEKYTNLIKSNYQEPIKNGLKFKNMVFKNALEIKRYGNITLATVPYTMTIVVGDKTELVTSYYYAYAGPKGLAWFFLDCNSATEKLQKSLVKGFDNNIKKPEQC